MERCRKTGRASRRLNQWTVLPALEVGSPRRGAADVLGHLGKVEGDEAHPAGSARVAVGCPLAPDDLAAVGRTLRAGGRRQPERRATTRRTSPQKRFKIGVGVRSARTVTGSSRVGGGRHGSGTRRRSRELRVGGAAIKRPLSLAIAVPRCKRNTSRRSGEGAAVERATWCQRTRRVRHRASSTRGSRGEARLGLWARPGNGSVRCRAECLQCAGGRSSSIHIDVSSIFCESTGDTIVEIPYYRAPPVSPCTALTRAVSPLGALSVFLTILSVVSEQFGPQAIEGRAVRTFGTAPACLSHTRAARQGGANAHHKVLQDRSRDHPLSPCHPHPWACDLARPSRTRNRSRHPEGRSDIGGHRPEPRPLRRS